MTVICNFNKKNKIENRQNQMSNVIFWPYFCGSGFFLQYIIGINTIPLSGENESVLKPLYNE